MADSVEPTPAPAHGRRAPAPGQRRRDAERTRRALLDAALAEFSAKGLAGARVSAIAARAGVNKQLISYYFGGKQGLYRALAERWLEHEAELNRDELSLGDVVAGYIADSVAQRDVHKVLLRECLDDAPAAEPVVADRDEVAGLRRRQEAGEIAADLDPALLLLALQGMASVGIVFPGDVRAVTGLDPALPEFAERYGALVRRIVAALAPAAG
ncbi:MAG TPA: TetR family transcriptional regulator [Baekduia sp.]|uniref:TetR family transcriptional regulator n=1 Tax=Baekduia sp. TaxID=2600305 RepID=UPI002BDA1463|nr:TetR family transcriptional regulator [Baekduia sp.]HMJ33808.1 TetR family transcriptional regulator [Baekduia sp.]